MRPVKYLCALGTVLALAGLAKATSVAYSVGGVAATNYPGPYTPPANAPHILDGLGYPGDAVAIDPYTTGTLDLTPGIHTPMQIGTLNWTINYTYNSPNGYTGTGLPDGSAPTDGSWVDLTFSINANTTISFGSGPAGALIQSGQLLTTWTNDYLTLNAGPTSTYYVQGFQIDVTPLGLSQIPGGDMGAQTPQAVYATFAVTAVPLPASFGIGFSMLAGFGALFGIRRRLGRKVRIA